MGDMDSGNSGSLQSSSCGAGDNEPDYESSSRNPAGVDSFSSLFPHVTLPPPPPSYFDPLPSYFDHLTRPHPTPPDPSPSCTPPDNHPHHPQQRNPRKRTRASRRAPTTVLTTDTSNFRAMVQEFTGIPSPPFVSPSPGSLLFPRTRFDLFNSNKNKITSDVMYPFKYPDSGPSKPGGSLELPITIRPNNNNNNNDNGQVGGMMASGLGLGVDAGTGGASRLGFAHQHIG